ncbi:unnamed protein product [Acanthoscelides obtectus]|uniref:Uncharacterized protein n=1 Tax=Acanthoscelides obtectus TaxID=200917 RepID=A0A9P0LLN5_ACAOB|nr:unnamed protein product [Acanthoscelides obtectus]CAK1681814.1 hypothetical protein AOBTE_LOCUS33288 [Acanthoscelides obtectus]
MIFQIKKSRSEGSKLNTSPLCTLKSSALRTPEDKENQIAHRLEGPESSRHQTRDWSKLVHPFCAHQNQ